MVKVFFRVKANSIPCDVHIKTSLSTCKYFQKGMLDKKPILFHIFTFYHPVRCSLIHRVTLMDSTCGIRTCGQCLLGLILPCYVGKTIDELKSDLLINREAPIRREFTMVFRTGSFK